MMANDVHDLPPPQQQQPPPQQQQQQAPPQQATYEAQQHNQSNGGGHYHQELPPPNNQEVPSGRGGVEEDANDFVQPQQQQQQVIPDDFAQSQPPPQDVQPQPTHNGVSPDMNQMNQMNATSVSDAMQPTTTTMTTMTAASDEVAPPQQAPQGTPGKTPKVQIVGQASPQQAVLTGSEKTEESPNYSSTQTSSISHVVNAAAAPPAPQRQNTWASFTANSNAKPSPSRRQLKTRDRISENIYGKGAKGKMATAKTPDGIYAAVNGAIVGKRTLWVSYNGHQKPFFPRCIEPKKWDARSMQVCSLTFNGTSLKKRAVCLRKLD